MSDKKLKKEDLILYILNKLEPERSDKIRLNKLAFLAEFSYLAKYGRDLSSIEYAAIDLGPVIDGYDEILKKMESSGLVRIDGYIIRPLKSPSVELAEDAKDFVDGVIEKYSKLSKTELIGLSHLTDAYKITTKNEKVMGRKINKQLAALETFLLDEEENDPLSEDDLPKINRSELIRYDR